MSASMRPAACASLLETLVFSLLLLASQGLGWKCDVTKTVCEVWLELDHALTMMKEKSLIVAKNGLLFPYDAANFSEINAVPAHDVISGDGWPEPRLVIAVNGTMPGPLLEVHEGQTVRVHVRNKMMSEATSVHFHGQHQRGTAWSDGVSFVSQCPILPGQTFTYQFLADPAGTHWYHSHTGGQTSMGVQGGFVVHPREGSNPDYSGQFTLLVTDWNHDWDSTMEYLKMQWGMYVNGRKESGQRNQVGAHYSLFRCQALLINGRGRYKDPSTGLPILAPVEVFNVRSGGLYRFRVIHSGSLYPFRLSVDGHKLRVVATDGMELERPVEADSVILTPAERYDFELNATQAVGSYWLRAVTLEFGAEHVAEAIVHYDGAESGVHPTSKGRNCTTAGPCHVVNCPFLSYPAADNTRCINVEQLRSAEPMPTQVAASNNVKQYFLNFAFPGNSSWTPASINGISMAMPRVAVLTQPLEFDNRCPGDGYRCGEDQQCQCANVLDIAQGDVVQLVLLNLGNGKGWDHPTHMHGHHFWVVKVGYPVYNNATGFIEGDNVDIDCRGNLDRDRSYCNHATWADSSWSCNTVPGLQLDRPVLKDSVNVPTGGYVVIRIRADNPGVWALHCHVSLHMSDGMLMLLNESYPQHSPPPPGLPRCGSFSLPYPEVDQPTVGTAPLQALTSSAMIQRADEDLKSGIKTKNGTPKKLSRHKD